MVHLLTFLGVSIFSLMIQDMRGLAAPNDPIDESSLLALKASITNNNVLAKNWTQGTPLCSWIGVTCGSKRHPFRVTSLNISYMGLEGTIPEEIGNLSLLSYLDVTNNSFRGQIPDTIGNLGRLRVLEMTYNQLVGRIPPSIGRLTKLEILFLSKNQLTGTIPSGIFNISSLLEIHISYNQLSGTVPQDICNHLPKLRFLTLSTNHQLSGDIPSSISACGALELLDLSFNRFSGSIPIDIGNLTQLMVLSLNRNNLTGVIPNSIGNLSNLETLDLGDNSLHEAIPSEIGHLSKLAWLTCAANKLNGIVPYSLFNLTNLQKLSLANNDLSGELPSSISTGLPNLALLYIASNRFSGTIPSSISNLTQLLRIDLGANSFSGLIPTSLGNIPNLQRLLLPGNLFTNNLSILEENFLSPLANSNSLNQIDFESNPITGVLPKSFFGANINLSSTLQLFSASSCGINGEIPTEISNLSNLISLGIGNNNLVGAIPESFGSLTKLQQLEIHNNKLQGMIPQSICNMTSLFSLSLWGNKLSGVLPLCLGTDLTSLQELYLNGNAFSSNIPSTLWSSASGILKIYLSNNFFNGTLSPDIGKLNSLAELDISGNQLSGDIPVSIRQLQSLTLLSLSNNKLNGSIPDSFSDLKALEHLDLSCNNLSGQIPISLESLKNLGYFNVSFNELSGEIPSEGPFENFTADCFIGNKGLCGAARFKVEACKLMKPSIKINFARYIIPPVALIFIAAAILFLFIRYHCRKSTKTSSISDLPPGLLPERIPYNDVLLATNNLDGTYLIGKGSFGSVYKGDFANGIVAAVKVFDLEVQGSMKSFDTECKIMRRIRHRNLVKVITSCSNLDLKALVLEYMPNGNLDKWLYSIEHSLSISQRFEVMVDVAAALDYLHHGHSTLVIHCDLKPSNILLDDDMVAHVSDFGIAKLLSGEEITQQTKTLGTIGYMAPEYGSGGFISTAVDVYSYGIVVLETFTRKKPTDEMFSEEFTMKKWVSESFPDSLLQIVDFELINTIEESVRTRHERCLTSIIKLALECTVEVPEERPTMKDILVKIKKINTEL